MLTQWQECLVDGKTDDFYITSFTYPSENECFATTFGRAIIHTTDNWKTTERIKHNVPSEQMPHYIEMTSKTDGVLVTRKEYIYQKDQFYVWTTTNGGHKWDLAFTSPVLNLSNSSFGLYYEDVLVEGFGETLFVLFADVIAVGNKDGTE